MRVRWVFGAMCALTLVAAAAPEAPGAPVSGRSLADPLPPHRALAAPLDASTLDRAPIQRHKSHPAGTRNLPRIVRPGVSAFLTCVAKHESGGNYKAENPISTASGKYQWIDSSWQDASRRAGRSGWSHAASAPPAIQDYVTAWFVVHRGHYPWVGTHCGYST